MGGHDSRLFHASEQIKNIFPLTLVRRRASERGMSRILPVIPALNAAASLPRALAALEEGVRSGLLGPATLADGGSRDGTAEIARRAGFHVVTGAQGRGAQLAAGARHALRRAGEGDWLLFMHADTAMEPGWSAEARRFMEANAHRDRAAHFRFALDDASARSRRLEAIVGWRCAALGLAYGDQGLLMGAQFYERLGGYRDWPLFEDVDLVRRIGRRRLTALRSKAVTSAERFTGEGHLRRSAGNLLLLARYYAGASPHVLAQDYAKVKGR
jgi:rSAM/selenodomain-associated transferase 2